MSIQPMQFDGDDIRRANDEATETWWFSVIDVVQVLTRQACRNTMPMHCTCNTLTA
ncbi:MAG: hypothetical protein RJA98_1384 [Pseudomonadota bacterium]|jgi:prophage antirepressor-like protein